MVSVGTLLVRMLLVRMLRVRMLRVRMVPVRGLVAAVLTGAALSGVGCTQQTPTGDLVQPPTTVTEPSTGTAAQPLTTPSTEGIDSAGVQVHARYDVPPDNATRALIAFLRARTESVIVGQQSPQLSRLTTRQEHRRQVTSIRFAVRQGYTVPSEPFVAVVSRHRRSFGQVLGVCLWLPSVEFVDAESGQPPSGPVPRQWAPALVTLRQQTVTWKVDKLSAPADPGSITCGGKA